MLEKETADVITLVLVAIVGVELIAIVGLGVWRRLYLQRFTAGSSRTASRPALRESRQSGSLRDTTAAPLHQHSTNSEQNPRDKK